MGTVNVSQRLNPQALRAQLISPSGGVMRDMLRRGLLVETQAKRNLGGDGVRPKRVDTGRLRASIATQAVTVAGQPRVEISTNVYYARWVHDGTGLRGPLHRWIKPKRARRLRFVPKGKTGYVYAKRTAGMIANPFLRDALIAARG